MLPSIRSDVCFTVVETSASAGSLEVSLMRRLSWCAWPFKAWETFQPQPLSVWLSGVSWLLQVWMGTVVDPEPIFPRIVSMAWTDPCDVEVRVHPPASSTSSTFLSNSFFPWTLIQFRISHRIHDSHQEDNMLITA